MEQYADGLDSMAGVEFYSGILCAGFVNAHSHIELSYLRGAIAEGEGFAAFAESIGKVRGNYSEEERLAAIEVADREMWQEGVDAVGDIVNGSTSFAAKAASPIHYHNFAGGADRVPVFQMPLRSSPSGNWCKIRQFPPEPLLLRRSI